MGGGGGRLAGWWGEGAGEGSKYVWSGRWCYERRIWKDSIVFCLMRRLHVVSCIISSG